MEGWLAGCLAATAVIDVVLDFFICLAEFRHTGVLAPLSIVWTVVISAAITFAMVCLLSALPAAVVIWLSKRFQTGSVWFFGGTGAVMGGVSYFLLLSFLFRDPSQPPPTDLPRLDPLFVAAGLAAGLAYWRVAERRPAGDRS
jgi:hypothetical protein